MKSDKGQPGSMWKSLKRCTVIVRCLQEGPASKTELMRAVRELVPDAYNAGTVEAQRKRFERDIERIRTDLQVIAPFDRQEGQYILRDAGPFLSVSLSPEALRGLAFLLTTFDEESAASEQTRPLLESIQGLLPDEQLRQLERHSPELEIDLHHLDEGDIPPQVWTTVRRAADRHHLLQFDYISPTHDPPERHTHIVEPGGLKFKEGHWQLEAYCRRWTGPHSQKEDAGKLSYRLTRIQPDSLEMLPTKFTPRPRRRRLVTLQYRLGPVLHRGSVSRRFEDMEISPVEPDGWVTVTAKTDDLFSARRILLAYGENCEVLAPPQLRHQMAEAARKMAQFYQDDEIPPNPRG